MTKFKQIMTDKEKRFLKEGIINLIDKFKLLEHGIIEVLKNNILSFIDSMQEEPTTSVWHDKEEKPDIDKRIFAICVFDKRFTGYYNEINPRYIRRWAYVEDLIKL